MAAIEDALLDLERRAINEGAGGWLAKVEELKRLVALGDAAAVSQYMSTLLVLPRDFNVAAAVQSVADAYMAGAYDSATIVARTATGDQAGAVAQVLDKGAPPLAGFDRLAANALDALFKAQIRLANGADPLEAAQHVLRNGRDTEMALGSAVHESAAHGTTAVARATDKPMVWVAERNACVRCLAHSGHVVNPGEKFPPGLTFGPYTYDDARERPPLHPHCRCHLEVLNDPEYAAALRREAERSVLRGYSLESESMSVRIAAAKKLIAGGVNAPKTVVAYAEKAIKAGKFPTRELAKKPGTPPTDQPRSAPKPPPKPPKPAGESEAAKKTREAREEAEKIRAQREALAKKQADAEAALEARMRAAREKAQADAAAFKTKPLKPPAPTKLTPTAKRKVDAAFADAAHAIPPRDIEMLGGSQRTILKSLAEDKTIPLKALLERAANPETIAKLFYYRHPNVPLHGWETADKARMASALGTVSDLLDQYPGVKLPRLEMSSSKAGKVGPGVVAYVGGRYRGFDPVTGRRDKNLVDNTEMVVSGRYMAADSGPLIDHLKESGHRGHFHNVGSDPVAYILAHEFGHALDNTLDKAGSKATTAEKTRRTKAGEFNQMSRYGLTNPGEGFAEAFADVFTNGARATAQSRAIVEKALRGKKQ